MENPWRLYQGVGQRSLYKNKYLKGRGLTTIQIVETMRKFKVYVNRFDQAPGISARLQAAEDIDALLEIIDRVFDNEWKQHVKDNYKDMKFYFHDYADYLRLIRSFVEGFYSKNRNMGFQCWPDGTKIQMSDFSKWSKAKHNHIKMTIDGDTGVYPGSCALIKVCENIGFSAVAKFNLTTNDMRLLVKNVPLGKETKYMEAKDGWHLCTCCETKVKLRLIKIIASHFHKDIIAELV